MVIVDINRDACQGVRPLPRDKPEGLSLDNHGVPEIRDEADSGVDERSIRTAAATCSDRAITIFGTAADTTIEGGTQVMTDIQDGTRYTLGGSWDHNSQEFHDHLYDRLADARDHCPVAHSDQHEGMWIVTRYEDVRTVLHDWRTFASGEGIVWPRRPELARQIPIDIDPPVQQEYRRALQPHFSVDMAARHREGARRLVTEMIDAFIERGHCDIAKELTRVYPARFFVEQLLGADGSMVDQLMSWGAAVARHQGDDIGRRAFEEMGAWIEDLFASSEDESGVVAGVRSLTRPDGTPLRPAERVLTLHTLIVGGLDTTANVLGNIIRNFANDPSLVDALNADRDLLPGAVEEFIRYEPPLHGLFRTVTREVELGGVTMRRGDHLLVSYASANRDASAFPHPDTIDLHRPSNRHVGFGLGPHRCVGIHVARVELLVALEQILDRMANIRLAGEVVDQQVYVRGPISMPISFTPGPRLGSS